MLRTLSANFIALIGSNQVLFQNGGTGRVAIWNGSGVQYLDQISSDDRCKVKEEDVADPLSLISELKVKKYIENTTC